MVKKSNKNLSNNLSVAVFHDYFAIRGGGERTVLKFTEIFANCTLVCGYRCSQSYPRRMFPLRNRIIGRLARFLPLGLHLPFLAIAFRWRSRFADEFDLRIYSGVVAVFAACSKVRQKGTNIMYCHTPPRFLYDQSNRYMANSSWLKAWAVGLFEKFYLQSINNIDIILTNSANTQQRIEKYLGRKSLIIYPPIDTERFKWLGQNDYYVSTARLEPLKRVELIVKAFIDMPEKKLVVVSGGSQLDGLKSLAKDYSNIQITGWLSDEQQVAVIGSAIATIYIPIDEDFGMSVLESMAAGKPVLGVREGGLLETIEDNVTGVLLDKKCSYGDIIKAINKLDAPTALAMKDACIAQAGKFSQELFKANIASVVTKYYPEYQVSK